MTKGRKQQTNENPVISAETVGKCCNKITNINDSSISTVMLLTDLGSDFFKKVCLELAPYQIKQASQAGIKLKNITLSKSWLQIITIVIFIYDKAGESFKQ